MDVALNGRFTAAEQPTGTHITALHLFDAIIHGPRDFSVTVFADPTVDAVTRWAQVPGVRIVDVPVRSWSRMRSQLWEQLVLPGAARRRGCSVVLHPINTCSLRHRGLGQVVTLHDLNFLHEPSWTGRLFGLWLRRVVAPAIRRSDYVVTVSDYVLDDARRTLGLDPARSRRVYNGLSRLPSDHVPGTSSEEPPSILGVNLWQPHKNLPLLIEAFDLLRAELPELRLRLIGRPQENYRRDVDLAQLVRRPGIDVLGYVSDADLRRAYATSTVTCYPSLSEGFGLPVLEALGAGASVVTSDVTSLPEVAGTAAILIDPTDLQSLVGGLRVALTESPDERDARRHAALARASMFDWTVSAQAYAEIFAQVARR